MSVSFQNRRLYELHPADARNFGVQVAALPSIEQLNLNHNCLRTLECPFPGLRGDDEGQSRERPFARHPSRPLSLRPELPAPSSPSRLHLHEAAPASTSARSLEEERSGLRSLTSLRQLLVSHNALRTLRGLSGAAHTLTTLIATHNHLSSLDGMQACKHLTYIDLSHNMIESLCGLPLMSAGLTAASSLMNSATSHAALEGAFIAVSDPALALSVIGDESADTSSLAFSCHTSPGAPPHLHLRTATVGRPSASTNTSVRFHIDETPSASAATPAALSIAGGEAAAAADSEHSQAHSHSKSHFPAAAGEAAQADVVLILSHNRLRGRALAAVLWVDGGDGYDDDGVASACGVSFDETRVSAEQLRRARACPALLRPWSTALTHLDLSHNYIEDVREVRRLLATVGWPADATVARPSAAAAESNSGGTCAVCTPALARLRHLDVSGNPFLVNGALAKDLQAASMSSTTSRRLYLDRSTLSARRPTVTPSEAPRHTEEKVPVKAPFAFSLRYESRPLGEALRRSAQLPAQSALSHLSAAQPAMEAVLRALAEDWSATPLLTPTVNGATSLAHFALFTPAERLSVAAAAAPGLHKADRTVLLHGAEVTVLAAALQQRGANLAEVLSVPAADRGAAAAASLTAAATRSPRSRRARGVVAAGTDGVDSAEVFLTPPPRWGSDASTSTTFLQTSLLSGGSPSPHQQQQQRHQESVLEHSKGTTPSMSTLSIANRPSQQALRGGRGSSEDRERGSDVVSSNAVETSTVGYRLYQSPGGAARAPSLLSHTAQQDVAEADAVTTVATPERPGDCVSPTRVPAKAATAASTLSPSRSHAHAEDAVALQLYKAEVTVLRSRFRELQRHTRDQTCVVQRHEATIRALTTQANDALRERDAAQSELARAQEEIRRLRALISASDVGQHPQATLHESGGDRGYGEVTQ